MSEFEKCLPFYVQVRRKMSESKLRFDSVIIYNVDATSVKLENVVKMS